MKRLWQIYLIYWLCHPGIVSTQTIDEILNRKPQKVSATIAGKITSMAFKRLGKAQKLMANERYSEALKLLNNIEKALAKNPYGLAQVYQTKGYLYAQTDRLPEAVNSFKKSLALRVLPLDPTLNTMFSLSQVLIAQEKYLEAIPLIQDFIFNKKNVRPAVYFFYGQVLTQLSQIADATIWTEKAVAASDTPAESWLRLLVSLYYEQKAYSKAASTLEQLVLIRSQKRLYWKQLSSVYLAMDQPKKALAVMESAYKHGVLTEEKEQIQLIKLSLSYDIPYKAGVYLQTGLTQGSIAKNSKNFELLADCWIRARENTRAMSALSKGAPLAENGRSFVRLGQLLQEEQNWQKSAKALKQGIKKGNLKKPGVAYISLGIALYETGANQAAIDTFKKAQKFTKFKNQAQQWLNYIARQNEYSSNF